MKRIYLVLPAIMMLGSAGYAGNTTPQKLIAGFAAQAGTTPSAARGKAFFTGKHSGGKPETPSCLTCHTGNLKGIGHTRAGKEIAPMARSANPKRFTDSAKVAKWFRRNCKTVTGRECSAAEKADILAYLSSI